MPEPEWIKAKCPICRREYSYLGDNDPNTCGRSNCLQCFVHSELEKDASIILYQREERKV